ncbi:hypothetical protein chiPu_0023941 [Chiloscyllium punctatum]|uniref:Uncharacterized protein n=1 Tax=Chiloscyllium punctatum TaxID=137246 RepID=A0A401TAY1_CHIPU|nr:hypothetical protein [Chiloscyllium punctatum]
MWNRRYLCDDEPANSPQDESRSQTLLQKLHREAKARQQQLEVKRGPVDEEGQKNQGEDENRGRKSKKRKREAEEEATISEKSRKKARHLSNESEDSSKNGRHVGSQVLKSEKGNAGLSAKQLHNKKVKRINTGVERKRKHQDQSTNDTGAAFAS